MREGVCVCACTRAQMSNYSLEENLRRLGKQDVRLHKSNFFFNVLSFLMSRHTSAWLTLACGG